MYVRELREKQGQAVVMIGSEGSGHIDVRVIIAISAAKVVVLDPNGKALALVRKSAPTILCSMAMTMSWLVMSWS